MTPNPLFYPFLLAALVLICLILHVCRRLIPMSRPDPQPYRHHKAQVPGSAAQAGVPGVFGIAQHVRGDNAKADIVLTQHPADIGHRSQGRFDPNGTGVGPNEL